MIIKSKKEIKILLFGYINMNLMDGSAVFLSGIASMFAKNPNIKIDFVLASPVKRDILMKPLLNFPNITIIDPYQDTTLHSHLIGNEWINKQRMTFEDAGSILEYYWEKNSYDWFFIRSLEIAEILSRTNSPMIKKTFVYVTGITHENQQVNTERQESLVKLFQNASYLVCQTKEMKKFLLEEFKDISLESKTITLNPMIPDSSTTFDAIFKPKEHYNRLCYTGKFAFGWNSIPMIVAFRELIEEYPDLSLNIAGDKFNIDKNNPSFIEDLKYLLTTTKNLTWHGALSRDDARDLIINSDIGITWRDKSMDSSLELSTKLLEYGSLGKAVIMNPTEMHKDIFGEEYPLYAETFEDFIQVIRKIQFNPELYRQAAEIMFNKSQSFTYTSTLKKLLPYFFSEKKELDAFFIQNGFNVPKEIKNRHADTQVRELEFERKKSEKVKCFWYAWELNELEDIHSALSNLSEFGKIKHLFIEEGYVCTIVKGNQDSYEVNFINNIKSEFYSVLIKELYTCKAIT